MFQTINIKFGREPGNKLNFSGGNRKTTTEEKKVRARLETKRD